MQINKYISNSGYCSRREADLLILQERVKINGKIALPISRVEDNDKVSIDDEYIKNYKKETLVLAYNKPLGITCTTDTKDKTNIIDAIQYPKRIFPIGRLDKDSEGLILLTDDGDIVNKILRAGNAHDKEYLVVVDKQITPDFIDAMQKGVPILDTITLPCKIIKLSNKKFKITLQQGLNRQIRRMCETLGYKVMQLTRIRIMDIHLDNLKVGKWRKLNSVELDKLKQKLQNSVNTYTPTNSGNKPKHKKNFSKSYNTKPRDKKH